MKTTKNFGVLLWTLVALSTTIKGSWSNPERKDTSVFFPSAFSSFESSGATCLNGGTSVPSLTTGEHMFCLCADGFEGRRCETGRNCYVGQGLSYRGTVSKSRSGRTCEEWDLDTRQQHMSSDVNGGRHNYCRNLFYRRRPWCYVRRKLRLVPEYCDIPHCSLELSPPLPAATEPAAEMTCGQLSRRKQLKIVGGEVTTTESHPWFAAIFWRVNGKEVLRCGGSLISTCWILTAAHCFPDGSHASVHRFSVILGKNDRNVTNPLEQKFRVEKIIVHEGFNDINGDFNDDIALIKLKAKHGRCARNTNFVKTVCLPPFHQPLQPGAICEVVGLGSQKEGAQKDSRYLKEAQVNIFPNDMCEHHDYYGKKITHNMFCAGRPDWSRDACQGDSGGPLACEVHNRFFLFGIVSWGEGCARPFRPGVYTKVPNYNRWIEEKTGLTSITSGAMFPEK